ncbi:sugar transferase [Phaeovulum sp.]|uniref:sugar transferase n=1 Tax=Phaeovulum sp. TaxID=2934796 RepID=UPI00272F3021|nr:sugar transferase [Phaeovulum sp.]MDP1667524.1 sugar transferase [Phaeovulum sp.]MDZ4120041.1 sugar transferase [Phaeovulum sp.]
MYGDRQEFQNVVPLRQIGSGAAGYFGKRIGDIVLGLCMLPILAPLIALLWCLVRLDGGPGFFGHLRVGRNGRAFRCWKLRTMVPDAEVWLQVQIAGDEAAAREWRETQKLRNDPRITRLGRFLRRSSLDELPQIWNIVAGEMSFVGPRPFTPDQLRLYLDAGGRAYFQMRPGITGPWQVFGRTDTRFDNRVRFDETYHCACSPGTDLGLLLRTVSVVLAMTGR